MSRVSSNSVNWEEKNIDVNENVRLFNITLDINSSKRTMLLLLFYISVTVWSSTMSKTHTLK